MVGTWDVDGLLDEIPPSLLAEWRVRYMLRPWDAANTRALAEGSFERPGWLEDLVEDAQERMKKQAKPEPLNNLKAIMRHTKKKNAILGWTWP